MIMCVSKYVEQRFMRIATIITPSVLFGLADAIDGEVNFNTLAFPRQVRVGSMLGYGYGFASQQLFAFEEARISCGEQDLVSTAVEEAVDLNEYCVGTDTLRVSECSQIY